MLESWKIEESLTAFGLNLRVARLRRGLTQAPWPLGSVAGTAIGASMSAIGKSACSLPEGMRDSEPLRGLLCKATRTILLFVWRCDRKKSFCRERTCWKAGRSKSL